MGMNAWLVIGRCVADDVPLRLCGTKEEAFGFAEKVTDDLVIALGETLMNTQISEVVCVVVMEFRHGRPLHLVEPGCTRSEGQPSLTPQPATPG